MQMKIPLLQGHISAKRCYRKCNASGQGFTNFLPEGHIKLMHSSSGAGHLT